jgi:hypothetical protein
MRDGRSAVGLAFAPLPKGGGTILPASGMLGAPLRGNILGAVDGLECQHRPEVPICVIAED